MDCALGLGKVELSHCFSGPESSVENDCHDFHLFGEVTGGKTLGYSDSIFNSNPYIHTPPELQAVPRAPLS